MAERASRSKQPTVVMEPRAGSVKGVRRAEVPRKIEYFLLGIPKGNNLRLNNSKIEVAPTSLLFSFRNLFLTSDIFRLN